MIERQDIGRKLSTAFPLFVSLRHKIVLPNVSQCGKLPSPFTIGDNCPAIFSCSDVSFIQPETLHSIHTWCFPTGHSCQCFHIYCCRGVVRKSLFVLIKQLIILELFTSLFIPLDFCRFCNQPLFQFFNYCIYLLTLKMVCIF